MADIILQFAKYGIIAFLPVQKGFNNAKVNQFTVLNGRQDVTPNPPKDPP